MAITVPKPTTKIDDGFYHEANAACELACDKLAALEPPPQELVDLAKSGLLRKIQKTEDELSHIDPDADPFDRWARGRAALSAQMTYWSERFNRPLITVQDFYATDTGITSLFPAWIESEIQAGLLAAGLVNELTFGTETVAASKITGLYDSTGEGERSLRKVSEGAELPKVKLSLADSTIALDKYGRQIEASYESVAQQRLDALGAHLRKIAIQVAIDETDTALHILVAGDGTTAGAAESNSTDHDVAAAGSITYADLIGWYFGVSEPYRLDKCVLGKTDLALIANLSEFKDPGYPGFPSNLSVPGPKAVKYLWWQGGVTGSSYVDRLGIGIDSRHALRKYVWQGGPGGGGMLQEQERIITRQVNVWTFSYYVGFRKWDYNAVHPLDCNAVL
jgi:hypothetical protein